MSVLIHHFILTRFNLLLWNKDKEGNRVRTIEWLEHRFLLFEWDCLPSIVAQTCHDFQWIVLFDSTTPERFKEKIADYQKKCPQMVAVFVRPEGGRYFAQIFRDEVFKRVQEVKGKSRISELENYDTQKRVITTYLDNDDALNVRFVEDIQRRAADLPDGTIITYDDGYQYFTDHNYVMKIHFPRNHFMSAVERSDVSLKTIYGYGSHYYVEKIDGIRIEHVKDVPMWCEVIHEKNMGNDAYFFNARMVKKADGFGFMFKDTGLKYGLGIYMFRFLPRYFKTFVRRIESLVAIGNYQEYSN